MTLQAKAGASGLVERVRAAVGKKAAQLVPLLYGGVSAEVLGALGANWLGDYATETAQFIAQKPAGGHKLRIRRIPNTVQANELWAIEILNDDMPFLVDSVLGEIQARGIAVALLLHPTFKTRRDAAGRLQEVDAPGKWSDGHQESFMAVHVEHLSDAARQGLAEALAAVLGDVRVVVADWRAMLDRLGDAIRRLETAPRAVPPGLLKESVAFLKWLEAGNFTFLGLRQYRLAGSPETGDLVPAEAPGLGVLRNPAMQVLRRGTALVAMTPEIRRFFFSPAPLIVSKANVVSRVHRRTHMDYVGIKTYRSDGTPDGEIRIVGLFTSLAYVSQPRDIPLLRHKVAAVFNDSGCAPASHDGKALLNILDTFPRDELIQIEAEQLKEWAVGILDLETRPRVRVFARIDRFDRFVSLLVYVPRDRYNTAVRERIGALLAQTYNGHVTAFYPYFQDGPLVRVQFIIGRYTGATPHADTRELERAVAAIVQTWEDRIAEDIRRLGPTADTLQAKYREAFPAGYKELFSTERALQDIQRIERLGPGQPIAIDFYREPDAPPHRIHAAIYRFGAPIPLSQRVPILENFGFSAIDERSYHIRPRFEDGARDVILHDMVLETSGGAAIKLEAHDKRLESAFLAVFGGEADNDSFNRLVIGAGAEWREAAVLRAYAAYLRQLGSPFGLRYLADTVSGHAQVARDLLELFHLRFDRARKLSATDRRSGEEPIRGRIETALAAVSSLDEDRILRQFLNLIGATVRTNFYQAGPDGRPPETIAFKFDSKHVEAAPQPRPFREIWVHAPRVEGVHLRFAPIARGGIRWSDRAQDFRTEILGLVRAQLVKNAVIVPSGAKGGFLPKQLPRPGTRDEVQKEGAAAYRIFISALLDITDNIKDGRVVPPARVVRHDGDDAYLVVAADKGTATFSDLANQISAEHDFWLGDAFASGGSEGYDHKKMGITARGAWECVKRHFREMDIDIQQQPFRVAGVGDMSGDVFGNGMLLSPHIRLVAAFDHRDIFIDPNPPAGAFGERQRLFDLPRSSWQDYDKTKISKGGGVFSRSAKSVPLSAEMRSLLGLDASNLTPAEIIRAVLKCKVDLLWFGGIGTYLRASGERNEDVGDRANDALRVTAAEINAKVIGEGANLGMTQRARIEFASRGGRLNTDFIDNSAGVNTSDQEVNIKIAIAPAVRSGKLGPDARKTLLMEMTDDVAKSSLRNNYQQSLALSLAEHRSAQELPDHLLLIRALENSGMLDRELEGLPKDTEAQERARAGRGLTRPELAVLLSYAKLSLQHELLQSAIPDEPMLESWLTGYFPPILRKQFADGIAKHSLRREIIALGLVNTVVNRGGPAMVVRLAGESRRATSDVAYAFLAAREVFALSELWDKLDALDGKVPGQAQLELYELVQSHVRRQTLWFLRDNSATEDLAGTIARHRAGLAELRSMLGALLPARRKTALEAQIEAFAARKVPSDVVRPVVELEVTGLVPAIVEIAEETKHTLQDAARAFLVAGDEFRIPDLIAKAGAIVTSDTYDRLALAQAIGRFTVAQAMFAKAALRAKSLETWQAAQRAHAGATSAMLEEIASEGTPTVSRLLVAAGLVSDLAGSEGAVPSALAKRRRAAGHARSATSGSPPSRKRARPART
jgi:glutamate dehydrogenase